MISQHDESTRRLQAAGQRMNWSNVKLILAREIRDQLRDRRTLFMIAVLPILLYPLLGMSMFQMPQFMQEQPTRVLVVGARATAGETAAVGEQAVRAQPVQPAGGHRAAGADFSPEDLRGPDGRIDGPVGLRPGDSRSPASTTRRSTFRPTSANSSSDFAGE